MKVISRKHLPVKLPLNYTLWTWFLLERFNARPFFWGAGLVLLLIVWCGALCVLWQEKPIELEACE